MNMESETKTVETETVEAETVETEQPKVSTYENEDEVMTSLTKSTNNINTEQPWQEWVDTVVDFVEKMPEMIGKFYTDYQKPLNILGLTIIAGVTVYITLSVLEAIGNIPLLSSILELVGLGYSVWFVLRYLLKASTREELSQEFDSLKGQFLGGKSEES